MNDVRTRVYNNDVTDIGDIKDGNLIKGIRIYPSGQKDEGKFLNNKFIDGVRHYSNGCTCFGEFLDNKFVKGVWNYPNGSSKEGIFVDNIFIEGTFTNQDTIDKGSFENGTLTEGKRIGANYTSEGIFINGIFVKGIHTYEDGTIDKGTFEHGELLDGKATYPNGDAFEGHFVDEKLQGIGKIWKNKKLFKAGEFKDGEMKIGITYVWEGNVCTKFDVNGYVIQNAQEIAALHDKINTLAKMIDRLEKKFETFNQHL
jgi:hypothetical protein